MFGGGQLGALDPEESPPPARPCTARRWNGKGCDGQMTAEKLPPLHKGQEPLWRWSCPKCGRIEI